MGNGHGAISGVDVGVRIQRVFLACFGLYYFSVILMLIFVNEMPMRVPILLP